MAAHNGNLKQSTSLLKRPSVWAIVILVAGIVAAWVLIGSNSNKTARPVSSTQVTAPAGGASSSPQQAGQSPELQSMEVAKAVMVTVELDFGPNPPTIRDALLEVERRYRPDDGVGRTFAILDAYGEQTSDGKLHISMHVSSEKPGLGSLTFRRTGEILWQSRILPGSSAAQKSLVIYINDERGSSFIVDGSNNPRSILDAVVRDKKIPVREFWPDAAEREVTFVYSACGCPVKVLARRLGDRTVRIKDTPVIFPDDPAAVSTIDRLMGW